MSFFLTEAEDAGEDEEEDEYDNEVEKGLVEDEAAEKEAHEFIRRRQEQQRKMNEKSAEEIAAEVEARYRSQARARVPHREMDIGDTGDYIANEVSQQSLLPSVHDPGIWLVRCKPGSEMTLVRSVMLKAFAQRQKDEPLKIKSVFSTSKGYIYIEAIQEPYARDAIQGLRGFNHGSFKKVPIQNMTALLSISVMKKPLKEGQLVRVKRGNLKGDLVKIVRVVDGGSKALIQAVPRLDFNSKLKKDTSSGGKGKGNVNDGIKIARPPQKLFDLEDAKRAGMILERKKHHLTGEYYDCCNGEYFKDGFSYKEVNVETFLNASNVKPTLEELQMFREKKDRTDPDFDDATSEISSAQSLMRDLAELQEMSSSNDNKTQVIPFRVDDLVQVIDGELRNMVGRILVVNEAAKSVKLRPISGATNVEIDVEVSSLVKYIRPGAHVKAVAGIFCGQTGRVVTVSMADGDHVAAIITDGVQSEITCSVAHLQVGFRLYVHAYIRCAFRGVFVS